MTKTDVLTWSNYVQVFAVLAGGYSLASFAFFRFIVFVAIFLIAYGVSYVVKNSLITTK